MAAASLALQSLIPGYAARQRSHMFTHVSGRVKRLPCVGSMCTRRRPCSWIFAVRFSCVIGHSQAAAVHAGTALLVSCERQALVKDVIGAELGMV